MKNQDDIKEARAALSALVASETVESVALNHHGIAYLRTLLSTSAEPALPSEEECLRALWTAGLPDYDAERKSFVLTKDDAIAGMRAVLDLIRSRASQLAGTIAAPPSDDDIAAAYAAAFAASTANNDWWKHADAIRAVGELVRGRAVKPDLPIADPAERARAVARELRRRGIWAGCAGAEVHLYAVDFLGLRRVFVAQRNNMTSVHAIADEIQREEARRAATWAGDKEES